MNKRYNNAKPWQIFCFAFNNSSTNVHFFMIMAFFMVYCTDNLGLQAALIGLTMTLTRILDGFTDPVIGLMIDKTDTKFGKFRPFMFFGAIIMNVSFLSIFWGVKFESQLLTYIWLITSYIIWIIGYTCCAACTRGGLNVLTNNPKQRPILSGIDTVVKVGIYLMIISFGVTIMNKFGGLGNIIAFRKFAFLVVGISILCTTLAIIGIWEKDNNTNYPKKSNQNKAKAKDYIPLIKNNKALQMLILAASTNKIALNTVAAVNIYFFTIVVGDVNLIPKINAPAVFMGILGGLIGVSLAVKYSKKHSLIWLSYLSVIVLLFLIVVRPFDTSQIMMMVIAFSIIEIGSKGAESNIIPMVSDTADYEYYQSQKFVPGMVSTIFSFVDKMVSSLSGLLIGLVLTFAGYEAGVEATAVLYWSIMFLYLGVPLLGHVFTIIAMKYYPIDREFIDTMVSKKQENNHPAMVQEAI